VSNDVTVGELDRRLRDHEKRSDNEHKLLHARIDQVAASSVHVDVHDQIEHNRDEDLENVRSRVGVLEAKPGVTKSQILAVVTVTIGIIGLVIQAYSAAQGAK